MNFTVPFEYRYKGMIKEWTGPKTCLALVDLGFARHVWMHFDLADCTPIWPDKVLAFAKTWTAENPKVIFHVERGYDRYEAYVWRGNKCLNLDLREENLALG